MGDRLDRGTGLIERGNARISRGAGWLAVVAAMLTVGSGILGLNLNTQSQRVADLRARVLDLENEALIANATIDSREKDIGELNDENRLLKAALPLTVADEDIPELRATSTLVLTTDYELDLNSVIANFNQQPRGYYRDGLTFADGEVRFDPRVSWLSLAGPVATYQTCSVATGWRQSDRLDVGLLTSADVCLRLESGRIAKVVVDDVQVDQIELTIAVWRHPMGLRRSGLGALHGSAASKAAARQIAIKDGSESSGSRRAMR